MNWIKCSERLPKRSEHKEIITFQIIKCLDGEFKEHISIDPMNCLFIRKKKLYSDFGNEEVTHWMPLPPLPEEK